MFQTGRMSNTTSSGHWSGTSTSGASTGVGGALSLMGCVREASPQPQDHDEPEFGDLSMPRSVDTLPKEPKKRRFHPLRGLRRIFRRKSRTTADTRLSSRKGEDDSVIRDKKEIPLRHPAGRPEDIRSQSASELLTDSCERQSVFLRQRGAEESLVKLRGASGQLSVSHDSVFPGEVPHTRPLSSLDTLATLQRRQAKVSDETVYKDYSNPHAPYNHRISLRVLEQIKTAIESRNQLASAESTHASHNYFSRGDKRERVKVEERFKVTRTSQQQDNVDRIATTPKEELPELESASLNHTAAHHRISVRPKNRRPPKRSTTTSSISCSTITTVSENSDDLDSLELVTNGNANTPVDQKTRPIHRKSSGRISKTSEILEEHETKLSKKPPSVASLSPDSLDISASRLISDHSETEENREQQSITRKPSIHGSKSSDIFEDLESKALKKRLSSSRLTKSPDSLDNLFSKSIENFDVLIERDQVKPTLGRLQNPISKSTEGFEKFTEQMEVRTTSRRLTGTISKSTEAFDKFEERDEPRSVTRTLLNPTARFPDIVSKSSDSLEAIDTLLASDDTVEQRRSSFEIRPRRNMKIMSMSSENFEALGKSPELCKRSSASDVHLLRVKRHSQANDKIISKSTENFETLRTSLKDLNSEKTSNDFRKHNWRTSKRAVSSFSDNFEIEDKLDDRKVRTPPKRISSSTIVDIFPRDNHCDDSKRPVPMKKPSRVQKSSESSELGSTDTLDSERRNKSSDSTETLDSLEKDLDQNQGDENISNGFVELRNKNDTWSSKTADSERDSDRVGDSKSLTDKSYWRQTSDSKENIDIHQLLAITMVNRIDNGNNQRNSAPFSKKKLSSPPISPVAKQEDNKLLMNNLLTNKNDEELQNMLNGNISEVSTDTKSFKEKLIMFEKLGK